MRLFFLELHNQLKKIFKYSLTHNIFGLKRMKKGIVSIGVFLISILMVSTATAVPTTQSTPVMDLINTSEEQGEQLGSFEQFPQSILNLIWQIILLLINLVIKLIEIVNIVITIIQLVQALISGLQTVFQLIQTLIEFIRTIINPDMIRA